MRTDMSSTGQADVVSYAVQENYNELLIFTAGGSGFTLTAQGKIAALGALPVWDGKWHAVCATWRSTDGAWQVYTDGVLQASGSGLNVGGKVRSGGTWILAQDQDTVGGGFELYQTFSGELSQVNLWDRVLTAAEIGTDVCGQHGNAMDWETTDIEDFGLATSDEYHCGKYRTQLITFAKTFMFLVAVMQWLCCG
ncbi:neuronal pentraxin receptor-like [Branchiostoma floridae]|uniref:Pentraxin family member n=1 Tax=Branchiostoma floridae TaxID=7739 RepID=A0A9J7L8R6_BRAFL|nr:neuronal pentraxin receptor-like [Branchiostoma floridae]XP_035678071.1 neuronal pentraxin receptor-like [Branchiostoma floridae]